MASEAELRHRPWAIGVAVIGSAMAALYVALIGSQGDHSVFDVLPWVLLVTVAAVGALSSRLIEDRRIARKVIIGSAVLFGLLGILSALSIGFGYLPAAAASAAAARM